jgi:hypothetical protein
MVLQRKSRRYKPAFFYCSATSKAFPMSHSVTAAVGEPTVSAGTGDAPAKARFFPLAIGSIGVVYGDIGTSTLYAFREAISAATGSGNPASEPVVLGILSLIIWALLLIVTAKYIVILLRADNKGEGGTLALMALASHSLTRRGGTIILLGIVSGALFYGDAIITPALSVLSAIEGLKVVTPTFDAYVVPLTVVVLLALFAVQSRGTASVATFFGPVMMLWFGAIAAAGIWHAVRNPVVFLAFNPIYGVDFLFGHGLVAFFTLGAVFLVVTGAEALYADLGHFGRAPIRFAWLVVVLPALALNYLGQGALVLSDPKAIENPFFLLYPEWALLPMVLLATIATVIASQFAHAAGYPAGIAAAPGDPAYVGSAVWPNLYASRQHAASVWRVAARDPVSVVECIGFGLRDRRNWNDGRYSNDGNCGRVACLELAARRSSGADHAVSVYRPHVSLGESSEDRGRRMDAAGAGRRGDVDHVHLAAREPAPFRKNAPARGAA